MKKSQKMRKVVGTLFAATIMAVVPINAYAASGGETIAEIMSSSFVSSISDKTVKSSGYSATVTLKSNCTGTAYLYLQVQNSSVSGGWETVDTTVESFTSKRVVILSKKMNISAGSYRLHTHVESGNETHDDYSTTFNVK